MAEKRKVVKKIKYGRSEGEVVLSEYDIEGKADVMQKDYERRKAEAKRIPKMYVRLKQGLKLGKESPGMEKSRKLDIPSLGRIRLYAKSYVSMFKSDAKILLKEMPEYVEALTEKEFKAYREKTKKTRGEDRLPDVLTPKKKKGKKK